MPEIHAELLSDAALGTLPVAGFTRGTLRYIPGSVLRGAVATRYLAAGNALDATFTAAFEGSVRWGALYLRGEPPQPLSWWVHKYEPKTDCPKYYDDARDAVPANQTCANCDSPLEPSKGAIGGVDIKVDTHVKLVSGTASDGDLFARERIVHQSTGGNLTFSGRVDHLSPSGEEALKAVWKSIAGEPQTTADVWFGGRRSTNGGRARLSIADKAPAAFQPEGTTLTIRLTSPGIFVDDFGRPSANPRADELTAILGVEVSVQRSWLRWASEGGWHAASKLPKPVERVVAAGSVYELGLSAQPSPDALAKLAVRGLGLRKAEGFGAVAPMPAAGVDIRKLRNAITPLRGLDSRYKQALIADMQGARQRLQSGQSPQWRITSNLTNPPQGLRQAKPHDWKGWARACQLIIAVDDPDVLQALIDHLRSAK